MKTVLVLCALVYCALCFDALYTNKPVIDIATGNGRTSGVVLNSDNTIAYFTDQLSGNVFALDLVTLVRTHVVAVPNAFAIAIDNANKKLFIGDCYGTYSVARVFDMNTNTLSLLAGGGTNTGEGVPALQARLGAVCSLAFDAASNKLYMATSGGIHSVRALDISTGLVNTIAGTGGGVASTNGAIATATTVGTPQGLCLVGSKLYIAEMQFNFISYVDFTDNRIYRLAGIPGTAGRSGDGGPALAARFTFPMALFHVPATNRLYVADHINSDVRYIDLTTGTVEYVGGGPDGDLSSGAIFSTVRGANTNSIAIDTVSNTMYITEYSIDRVRRVGDGPTCSTFDTTKYGAKKPVVKATASGSTVTIAVTMYRQTVGNTGTPIFHNLDTKELESNTCRTTNNNIVASAGASWVKTSTQCADTYTLTQTLTQIVDTASNNNNNWVSTLDANGRSITYEVPIFGTYSVNNAGECYYVGFRSKVSFRTLLSIASTSSSFITADNSAKFQFSGLRITSNNEFEISGKITPLVPNGQLKNIALKKVTGNIAIPSVLSNECNTYNTPCDQMFRVSVATLGGANSDLTSQYDTTMDVYEGGVKTRDAVLSYQLSYIIPSDPTVVDSETIMTENKFYTSNTYETVRTASYSSIAADNDKLYIQNGITDSSPVIPTGYKLRMVSGYLCCVEYATTISAYDPEQDSGGCRDSAGKLEWVNLGSESSHPASVAFTSADVNGVGPKKYRLEVTLNTAYSAQNIPHAAPMTCQVLLVSKLEAPARRIGASNLASTFVSTSSFLVEANNVASSANIVGISITAVLIVLMNLIL